jgi:hypothetical protein
LAQPEGSGVRGSPASEEEGSGMSLVQAVMGTRLERMPLSPLGNACREVVRRALWLEEHVGRHRHASNREYRALIYVVRLVSADQTKTLGDIIAEEPFTP